MTPRTATLLALCGILLAGLPLPYLTGVKQAPAAAATPQPPPATAECYVTVQFSGRPCELSLWYEGRELARLPESETASQRWELTLPLPDTPALALEVMAHWAEAQQAHAITLTLEPQNRPQRECTRWGAPGTDTLHELFTLTW